MSIGEIATLHTGIDSLLIERDAKIMAALIRWRDACWGTDEEKYYESGAKVRDMVGRLQRERGRTYAAMVVNKAKDDQPKPKVGDIMS